MLGTFLFLSAVCLIVWYGIAWLDRYIGDKRHRTIKEENQKQG